MPLPSTQGVPGRRVLFWRRYPGPQPASLIEHFVIAFIVTTVGIKVGHTVLVVAGMSGAAVAHEIDDLWRDPEPQWWHGVQDLVAFGAGIGAALFIWRLGG